MTDFTQTWPLLTRIGEQEEIMKRLALYMDWSKVEEPEQADLLLEHYQNDVGRLIRTLSYARTPTAEMAAAVMELAEKHKFSVAEALRVMFFVFRLVNMAQGVPLAADQVLSPEKNARLLEIAMDLITQGSAYSGKLPCTECYEWCDGIPSLLSHMRSAHPHLNEGDRTMQENEPTNEDGGEAQAEASAEVAQPPTGEIEPEGPPGEGSEGGVATEEEEAAAPDTEESGGGDAPPDAPDAPEAPPETEEAPAGSVEGVEGVALGGESEPEPEPEAPVADLSTGDDPVVETEQAPGENGGGDEGDGNEGKGDEGEGEPEAETPVASGVSEADRTACLAMLTEMRDVTARNHMKPQAWWDARLDAFHSFITSA